MDDKTLLTILVVLSSFVLVFFNYFKDAKLKKESEYYIKKLNFYGDLIETLNAVLYDESYDGNSMNMIYHQSYLLASDEVIVVLNKYFEKFDSSDVISKRELRDVIAELILACRNDLFPKSTLKIANYILKYY